ncbi:MAG: hypothetical protein QMD05_08615 [Candidatus Brocadiaceae bacterium]|nr:hypothetical protein [Candidatus Brocadiaceae bacterium]
MTYNFYASNHKANSDARFSERVEFDSHEEALTHAINLRDNWGCEEVKMVESGEVYYIGEEDTRRTWASRGG